MDGYIINPKTWATEKKINIIEYDVPVETPISSDGTVKIISLEGNYQNYIVKIEDEQLNGYDKFFISGVETSSNNISTLKVNPVLSSLAPFTIGELGTNTLYNFFRKFVGYGIVPVWVGVDGYQTLSALNIKHSKFTPNRSLLVKYNGFSPWELFTYRDGISAMLQQDMSMRITEEDQIGIYLGNGDYGYPYYLFDFKKLYDLLCSKGFILKPRVEMHGIEKVIASNIAVGDGIEYDGIKYKISQIVSTQIVVSEDEDVDCKFYSTVAPTYNQVYRAYVFLRDSILRKETGYTIYEYGTPSPTLLYDVDKFDINSVIPIVFDDGHSFLLNEKYDDDNVISCVIMMYYAADMQSPSTITLNYYLNANMQITDNEDEQIQGLCTETHLEGAHSDRPGWEACKQYAEEIFAKNEWKHRVEFCSDKFYHYMQPVRLVLDRGILDTTISSVYKKSGDERWYYTCGDIPMTATQQIKANSWSYGQRLPLNPYKGQLVFM